MADAPLFLRPPVDAATTDIAVAPVDGSGGQRQELANGPFFGVTRRLIDGDDCRYETTPETAVVEGSGDATVAGERYLLQTGDHFVLPAGFDDGGFGKPHNHPRPRACSSHGHGSGVH